MTTKNFNNILKTVLATVFLITTSFNPLMAKTKQGVMRSPDFAFPKTVETDARKSLDKALKARKPVEALRAFMDLEIASSLISTEKTPALIDELGHINLTLPSPYNAIGCLLQAEIYKDIYLSDRWIYDSRTVDCALADNNPEFWDRNIFAAKIDSLIQVALSEKTEASSTPLDAISTLITHDSPVDSYTVYDFIVYKSVELNEEVAKKAVIPFFKTNKRRMQPLKLYESLLELHPSPSPARTDAILHKVSVLSQDDKGNFLWKEIEETASDSQSVPLLAEFLKLFYLEQPDNTRGKTAGSPISYTNFYDYLGSLNKTLKNSSDREEIGQMMLFITQENVSLDFPSITIAERDFKVKVKNHNLNDFYILLLNTNGLKETGIPVQQLSAKTTVVDYRKISCSEVVPFTAADTLVFSIEKPGYYTLIVSRSPSVKDILHSAKVFYPTVLQVSNIDIISIGLNEFTHPNSSTDTSIHQGCFVVDASNGAPIEGATVKFEEQVPYYRQKDRKIEKLTTNKVGWTRSPMDNAFAYAEFMGSEASGHTNKWNRTHQRDKIETRIFTDRAVYRPGDMIEFFGILFQVEDNHAFIERERKVTVTLKDANYQIVDSIKTSTDSSGRFYGNFTLPKEGLLGTWHIETHEGQTGVEVAEYKVPSLILTLEKSKSDTDFIEFKGYACSYSGMPVMNTDVRFNVEFTPGFYYFRNSNGEESYSGVTTTDAQGEFYIRLPLGNLDIKNYRGTFIIVASVTNKAGETVNSMRLPFWISDTYDIKIDFPAVMEITGDSLKLNVPVYDMAGMPTVKQVDYSISTEDGKEIASGKFMSPSLLLNSNIFPSGKYNIQFKIPEDEASNHSTSVIFYREEDKTPPIETPLWTPITEIKAKEGENKAAIPFGCSYKGQFILCIISNSKGKEEFHWIVSEGKNQTLEIEAPQNDERVFMTLAAYRDHNFYSHTFTIIPESQLDKLEISTSTFRNRMEPGKEEEWKFNLSLDTKPVEGYVYALLYDKAMNAIAPLKWNSNLFRPSYPLWVNVEGNSTGHKYDRFDGSFHVLPHIRQPFFNYQTYGWPLYGNENRLHFTRALASRKNAMFAEDAAYEEEVPMMETAIATGAFVEEGYIENPTSSVDYGNIEAHQEQAFRPIELPVAFFKPDLNSNLEGEVEIKFTVPDFNTTWNLIMGAYTPDLKSASLNLEAVASKKVMVKMFPPRFLRTGDNALINATVYNNSAEACEIFGDFEIFNPFDGSLIKTAKSSSQNVEPSGSNLISVEFICPDDLNMVGLRVYARSGNHSDGEQTIIPILPSSQPIVESRPFYLAPGKRDYSLTVPKMAKGTSVTFKYNDNPIWEAVTALPPISEPTSESLTALIAALYANSVGKGIFEKNPSLKKGLQMIINGDAGNNLLISNLEKDKELKTVSLGNTPWVNDAKSETLRLSRLSTLLEEVSADETINKIWDKIISLRNPDGGWSWCEGMKSSKWMTEAVIVNIGMLKWAGYLPKLSYEEEYMEKAIRFVDSSYLKDALLISGNKDGLYVSMLPYLYARSFYNSYLRESASFEKVKKEAVNYLDRHWEKLTIFQKATAAITLWREGRKMTAREILESLRQFSSQSAEKGVWFDNLDSGWQSAGKLLTTARVLSAFNEIQPSDSIIDGMRQWMVLQRQTQDWQEGLWSIDAIDALLSTGTQWTADYPAPSISIAGNEVKQSELSALTGEITLNIDTSAYDETIAICRTAPGPAWGGIISQYIAPMSEVKENKTTDLSISKEYWKIIETNEGTKVEMTDSFQIGDKVRITLIIDCGRDMDFVALTDERAACIEPVDQLSGYTVRDGLWCYSETRNSSTNFFFDFMPRGRHIVSYDCNVTECGEFASGIATLQCLYSPLLTSHSAGSDIKVR